RDSRHGAVSRPTRFVAGCLVAALAFCGFFAFASPPDPSWIPGVYDEKDADDIIAMVTEGSAISGPLGLLVVLGVSMWFVLRLRSWGAPSPNLRLPAERGPPMEASVSNR